MYYPGMITQTILVMVIIGAMAVVGYLGVKNHFQKSKIFTIEAQLKECELAKASVQKTNIFLQSNMDILNSYYNQKKKPKPPAIVGGQLKLENIFMGPPR